MAKAKENPQQGDDLLDVPTEGETPTEEPKGQLPQREKRQGNENIVPNPTGKIGLLIKYRSGHKEDAVQEAFELLGDATGLVVRVEALGLSRRYEWARRPKTNDFVPGHGHTGHMFIKFEPLV